MAYRKPVNKSTSAKQWKKGASKTKAPNARPMPSRGGSRL